MSNLTDNTAALHQLLEKAKALPEAGGNDGGSAAVETCQVQIDVAQSDATTSFVEVNGVPDATVMVGNISDTFTVLKNTIISVEAPHYYGYDCGDGVSFVSESNNYASFYFFVTGDGWFTLG